MPKITRYFHISKYEALQLEIQHTIESLYGNILDKLDFNVKCAYLDTYYHSCL
ncbi:MAG: hypothetical protein LBC56_06075 [Oscillospiraceae bacterium]|nr:hypothetical protein [Oscillospiraceae bacterium]